MASGLANYDNSESDPSPEALSGRQRQILDLLTQGKANKEIAYELGIGIGTVKQHLVALYKKMGVTNRAMAVSKGMGGHNIGGARMAAGQEDPYLERRSAVVLSLLIGASSETLSEQDQTIVRRVLSQNAMDFDALFLSSPGARGDVVFGLERTRRHDCLRAVRLAISVAEELRKLMGEALELRGGLACGLVLKGIGSDGSWTGEVIATDVISEARESVNASSSGALRLSASALSATMALGVQVDEMGSHTLPLSSSFRWSYRYENMAGDLFGRAEALSEIATFQSKCREQPSTLCIESEAGMGRSALVHGYDEDCASRGIPVHFYKALLPNSGPSGKSRGLVEPMTSAKRAMTIKSFLEKISTLRDCVVVVEDCHGLPDPELVILAGPHTTLMKAGVTLILTCRGRLNDAIKQTDGIKVIRLSRLDDASSAALVRKLIPASKVLQNWVLEKANGVPGFIVPLCEAIGSRTKASELDEVSVPYNLFSMIEERADSLGVSRYVLFATSHDDENVDLSLQSEELAKAQKAGFLKKNRRNSGNTSPYDHVSPAVAWVMAKSFVRRSSVFAR